MKKALSVCMFILTIILLISSCQLDMNNTEKNDLTKAAANDAGIVKKIIKDTGIIRYIDLEGGFYGIIGENGNYDPINLPRAFQQDGLKVEFTAELVDDMVSFHMWGRLIRLITMQTLENEKKIIMDVGVLDHLFIQGSPWILRGELYTYQLINLPIEFQVPGLKVSVVGTIRDDILIIPSLWPILEIHEIKKIGSGPIIVQLDQEFKLPVGESALVLKDEVLLTFNAVLSDSRCPIGVNCFWEGEATIEVNVKIGNVNYGNYKMSTLQNPSTINVGAYYIEFVNLYPYPVYNDPIDPDSYIGYFIIGNALENPISLQ